MKSRLNSVRCKNCNKLLAANRTGKIECCGETYTIKETTQSRSRRRSLIVPKPSPEWLAEVRSVCNRSCEFWVQKSACNGGCSLSPTKPCDTPFYHRKGFGCFADEPKYKPCNVIGWKQFQQPSMDEHCVAVTSLSMQPHHLARQAECIESWKRFGLSVVSVNSTPEVQELRTVYDQVDGWIVNDTLAGESGSKPTQRIYDLIQTAVTLGRTILLVNSDIEIYGDQSLVIDPLRQGQQVVGIRWNYTDKCYHESVREQWGLDAFTFTPEQAKTFPELPLEIGRPIWDYWVPLHSQQHGWPMHFVGERLFYHQAHEILWSKDQWNQAVQHVTSHYGQRFEHQAVSFRNSLPYPPAAADPLDSDGHRVSA